MTAEMIQETTSSRGTIADFLGLEIDWKEGDAIPNQFLREILDRFFPELSGENGVLPCDIESLIGQRNVTDDWFYQVKRGFINAGSMLQLGERKIKKRMSEELAKLLIKKLGVTIEGDDENFKKQKKLYVLFNELSKIMSAAEYEPPKLALNEAKFEKMVQNLGAVHARALNYAVDATSAPLYEQLARAKAELLDQRSNGIDSDLAYQIFDLVFSSNATGAAAINYDAIHQLAALALLVTEQYRDGQPLKVERCGSGYGHAEACAGGCVGCSFSPDNFDDPTVLTRPPSIPPEIMVPDALWKIKNRGLDHYKIVMGVGELYYDSTAFRDAIKVIRSSNRRLAEELGGGKRTTCASLGVVNDRRIVDALKAEGIEIEHYNSNFERPPIYYDGKARAIYEDGSSKRVAPFAAHHDFAAKVETYRLMREQGIKSCSGALIERVFPERNEAGARLVKVVCDDGREFCNPLAPYIDLFTTIRDLGLESAPFNARVNIVTDHLTQDRLTEEEYITLLSLFKLIHPKIKRIILNAGPESGGNFLPVAMSIGGGISAGGNYLTSGVTEPERDRMEQLIRAFERPDQHETP